MADALVHEWLVVRAGSELVFEALARCMPDADLFSLTAAPGGLANLGNRHVTTSVLDRPSLRDRRALTLPLMPAAWRLAARGREYETVVTSHHAAAIQFARHCTVERHLAYIHTPARYVWSPELDGRGSSRLLWPMRRAMQRSDRRAVESIDSLAANSEEVAARIRRFWNREARVIHPPVDTDYFGAKACSSGPPSRDFILGMSRFVAYKRLDLVIDAGDLLGLPVVIAGAGPHEQTLRRRAEEARVPVRFVIQPTNAELRELYRNAACLVFPAHEDFGIVPVEAQAAGTPVVGIQSGGVLESVSNGVTGILVEHATPSALARGVIEAGGISADACRAWASRFSSARFEREALAWIAQ